MNTKDTKLTDNSIILPFQRSVFDQLCAVARACLYVPRAQFKAIKLRCCFWLLGPTGSGKTHLTKILAKEMGVPFFSISASDWIVLGNSSGGSNNTWPLIVKFLVKNLKEQGAIIFIDEVDKCAGKSEWNTYLRTEIFSLCDARVPVGVKDSDSDSNKFCDDVIADVEDFLKNRAMIIAGSAFQELWEKDSAPNMGFNPSAASTPSTPELSDLTSTLPRELVNRFSSNMFVLPPLTAHDYRDMVNTMATHVPDLWRERFIKIGLANVDQAVRHQKGARYLEEIQLTAVVEEKTYLIDSLPKKEAEHTDEIEFKHDDEIHLF